MKHRGRYWAIAHFGFALATLPAGMASLFSESCAANKLYPASMTVGRASAASPQNARVFAKMFKIPPPIFEHLRGKVGNLRPSWSELQETSRRAV